MSESCLDFYNESNQDSTLAFSDGRQEGYAQSFTVRSGVSPLPSVYLTSCKFYLKRGAVPLLSNDLITAKLYAHSGVFGVSGKPIGDPIEISSPLLNPENITANFALYEFVFSGNSQLAWEGKYFIGISESQAGGAETLYVGINTSPTHDGNEAGLFSGVWTERNNIDLIFYVYAKINNSVTFIIGG